MRDFSPGITAALTSGRYGLRSVVRIDMPDGVVGYSDDNQAITIDTELYLPKPGLFRFRLPASVADGSVPGLEIEISGLDADVAAAVESEPYHQRPISVGVLIYAIDAPEAVDVIWWFSGFIDQIIRKEKVNGESRLEVKCEGHNRDLDRGGARTRSDADQRTRDPDDTFFAFVAQAKNTQMIWGRSVQNVQPQKPKQGGLAGLLDRIF